MKSTSHVDFSSPGALSPPETPKALIIVIPTDCFAIAKSLPGRSSNPCRRILTTPTTQRRHGRPRANRMHAAVTWRNLPRCKPIRNGPKILSKIRLLYLLGFRFLSSLPLRMSWGMSPSLRPRTAAQDLQRAPKELESRYVDFVKFVFREPGVCFF